MPIKNIILIGAGNVATQLGKTFFEKGIKINQVLGRTQQSADILASIVGAQAISDVSRLNPDAGLYIVAIPDDAIEELIPKIGRLDGIVVHTSGSVEMNILKNASSRTGVFYPLQTFSKYKVADFANIPLCIEASDRETEMCLTELASLISKDVRLIDSFQRSSIHLAAVFANNFTNYMYFLGEDFLNKKGISFDILLPLIRETAEKMNHQKPHEAQTGPAIRNDQKIISKHLDMLKSDSEKREIYRLISEHITKRSGKNK